MEKPSNSENGEKLACANCKRGPNSEADKSNFKLCSGCYKVHYCNRECQLADRKKHKLGCKRLTHNKTSIEAIITEEIHDLLYYCDKGDFEGLESVFSQDLDAKVSSTQHMSKAFAKLVVSQNKKCAELLLQHNFDPNANDKEGYTPLHLACQKDYDDIVSLLLQYKANPNIVNHINGASPLHLACGCGYDNCVSLLLQNNADANISNNKYRESPLYIACQNGHDKCVSLLLQAGSNMECIDKSGCTPFLAACCGGHLKCVALLAEHGANVHVQCTPSLQSALFLSCLSGNVNLVAYILTLGVDVNLPDLYGYTPLQCCHTLGLDKCAKLLIEHGAIESPMRMPRNSAIRGCQTKMEGLRAETKCIRQKAKHCDYPDCCNEGDDSQSLHACSSCRAVYYCSREHQEAHWKEHKKLCKAIKK